MVHCEVYGTAENMRDQRVNTWIVIVIALALLVAPELAWSAQCAMCRTGLANSPEGRRMASAFNHGIILLLCVPFVLAGVMAFFILGAHRRHGLVRSRGTPLGLQSATVSGGSK